MLFLIPVKYSRIFEHLVSYFVNVYIGICFNYCKRFYIVKYDTSFILMKIYPGQCIFIVTAAQDMQLLLTILSYKAFSSQ